MNVRPTIHCGCRDAHIVEAFVYDKAPEGETKFDLGAERYFRAYDRCTRCGHIFARHKLDLSALYLRAYLDATYGGSDGMLSRLEKIQMLPPTRSDNAGRVSRVIAFAEHQGLRNGSRLLDVGAGIGVFPAAMKQRGWDVEAIELDLRTAVHLRQAVNVTAYTDDLRTLATRDIETFDAVTFNKVIEHVEDPVAMLADALPLMNRDAFVYVEVPDVAAAVVGPGREEFFIEHLHVFSPASLATTIEAAGFILIELERLREPSGKFTLFAFAKGES